jgi:hypothetical protein
MWISACVAVAIAGSREAAAQSGAEAGGQPAGEADAQPEAQPPAGEVEPEERPTTADESATMEDSISEGAARPADAEIEPIDPIDPLQPDEDELPAGKWGIVGALRQNIGELGESYGLGWLIGIEAGYQPTRHGQAFSLGLSWSAMWGRFYAEDPGIADDPLSIVELNFGTRVRTALGEEAPRFLVGSAGLTVLRTSVPVPPDMERLYLGGYAGFGVEQYVMGWLVGLDARFGLLGSGPTGLTLVGSVSWGSP